MDSGMPICADGRGVAIMIAVGDVPKRNEETTPVCLRREDDRYEIVQVRRTEPLLFSGGRTIDDLEQIAEEAGGLRPWVSREGNVYLLPEDVLKASPFDKYIQGTSAECTLDSNTIIRFDKATGPPKKRPRVEPRVHTTEASATDHVSIPSTTAAPTEKKKNKNKPDADAALRQTSCPPSDNKTNIKGPAPALAYQCIRKPKEADETMELLRVTEPHAIALSKDANSTADILVARVHFDPFGQPVLFCQHRRKDDGAPFWYTAAPFTTTPPEDLWKLRLLLEAGRVESVQHLHPVGRTAVTLFLKKICDFNASERPLGKYPDQCTPAPLFNSCAAQAFVNAQRSLMAAVPDARWSFLATTSTDMKMTVARTATQYDKQRIAFILSTMKSNISKTSSGANNVRQVFASLGDVAMHLNADMRGKMKSIFSDAIVGGHVDLPTLWCACDRALVQIISSDPSNSS
jgi:hypothetical protein